jgi:hypothetical protein
MATYYGYAERDVQNQIDWSKVGKDVSDMLATEVQLREEKKAAIEKATQEYGEELSNQPVGQDAEANKILAEFADSAQELRLMQDRLLRSGSIKLKDYNMMRQNTTSGTGNMFDFADEYNEQFELFKKRLDGLGPTGKKSSEIEAWRVKKLGTFATFRNTKPTFNPATGELSLSEMVDDGNGQMVPKEGLSFSSLRNMLYEQTDQFEVLPAAQKISDSFAKTFKIVDPDGKLLTIDDIKQKPDYEETLSAFVNAELEGNPNAAASILVDYLRYSMDDIDMQWNEEQQTYVPNLTPKQEEEAAGALKQAVEATFQRVETPKPIRTRSSGKTPPASRKTDITKTNQMKKLYQAKNQREVKDALMALNQGRFTSFDFKYHPEASGEPAYYEVRGLNIDDSSEVVVGEIRAGAGEFDNLITGTGTELAQVKDIETARERGAFTGTEAVGSYWDFENDIQAPSIIVDAGVAEEQERVKNNEASLEKALTGDEKLDFTGVTEQEDFVRKFNKIPAIAASSFRLKATGSRLGWNYVSIVDSNNQIVTGNDIGYDKGKTRDDGKFYVGKDSEGAYNAIAKYILDNQDFSEMNTVKVP